MNWNTRRGAASLPRLLLLALCFFCGAVLGQVLAGRVPDTTGGELARYLRDYVRLEEAPDALLSTLTAYFRYPLLALLLGFASVGVVLLPALSAVFGCALSFSVCCFTAAFGREGVLLALAVLGLRCAVTAPVFFLTASAALEASAGLARVSLGWGRGPAGYDRAFLRRGVLWGLALLAGAWADLLLSPYFLQWALEGLAV